MSGALRAFATGAMVVLGLVSGVSGQVKSTPAPSGTMEDLIVEVRALRTEINQAAAASMRAQLLGIRLQLQEQRINVAARQLGDTQERQRQNEQARATLAAQLKMFDKDAKPEEKEELEHVFGPLRAQLEQLEKADQQLKTEEMAMSQLLTEEQSRWSLFNAQIEELEKAASKVRR